MLLKNIYILYPPGSGGTFINWAINASDVDTATTTITNPVNTNPVNNSHGGIGTAHLYTKLPPHDSIDRQIAWMIYNRPVIKQVYAVNGNYRDILKIREFDPDGVYIVIHSNKDILQECFSRINNVIKWPLHLYTSLIANSTRELSVVHSDFDPFDCANDQKFRNWLVSDRSSNILQVQDPVDEQLLEELIAVSERRYTARHSVIPHEVNERYYNNDFSYRHRLFQIDLHTLFSDQFISWFEQFMVESKISSEYNTDLVKQIRPVYMAAQKTLQWFESIDNWKKTGRFDDFITSHSAIEAEAIRYMLYLKPELDPKTNHNPDAADWDILSPQEFSDRYFTSDDFK